MAATSLSENRELVDRTARALDVLAPADLRRLLSRADRLRGIDLGGVVRAFGFLTAYAGLAFLYVIQWDSLSIEAQRWTPFLVPAALLVAAVVFDRAGRPAWEVELAAVVGDIALAVTFLGASGAWGGRTRDYGLAAALLCIARHVPGAAAGAGDHLGVRRGHRRVHQLHRR